jgi:ATP-dependent DNA ligase
MRQMMPDCRASTQAASDGERRVQVVFYAFDILHLGGWDISGLSLIERKMLLEPLVANQPRLQFNGHGRATVCSS